MTFTVEVSGLEAFALGKCVDLPNPYRESNPLKLVICHANDRPTTGDILDHVPFVLPSSRSLDASHHWA